MHKKFIFGVFEQYLFAYGDSHMGICGAYNTKSGFVCTKTYKPGFV